MYEGVIGFALSWIDQESMWTVASNFYICPPYDLVVIICLRKECFIFYAVVNILIILNGLHLLHLSPVSVTNVPIISFLGSTVTFENMYVLAIGKLLWNT